MIWPQLRYSLSPLIAVASSVMMVVTLALVIAGTQKGGGAGPESKPA
jgi:ABC-type spermidine/putrescine transport system permease subunit II